MKRLPIGKAESVASTQGSPFPFKPGASAVSNHGQPGAVSDSASK